MNIRPCVVSEQAAIVEVINDAARAYRDVIPADRWKEPYMPPEELRGEIAQGVVFRGAFEGRQLLGVMGLQAVRDVVLIRHAYVRTARRREGIGAALLSHLLAGTQGPVLIGTWAAAGWAIRFYEKHGFRLVGAEEKDRLLRSYWTVPERQIAESVVLASRLPGARSTG
jgi:GNAT superfamily N-acetyltransferase